MSCLCRATASPLLQPPAHPFPSTWPRGLTLPWRLSLPLVPFHPGLFPGLPAFHALFLPRGCRGDFRAAELCWLHLGGSRSVVAMLRVRHSPRVPGSRLRADRGGLGLSLWPQASLAPFTRPCCSAHLLLALSTPFSQASPRRPSPCDSSGRATGQRCSRTWARIGTGGPPRAATMPSSPSQHLFP